MEENILFENANELENFVIDLPNARYSHLQNVDDNPPNKSKRHDNGEKRAESLAFNDDDEASSPTLSSSPTETCIICLDPMYNFGNHRMVSLKCGHLFGKEYSMIHQCPSGPQTESLIFIYRV